MSTQAEPGDIVTYTDAAKWLPTDIREHVEATVPCISGGQHEWHHQAFDVTRMESAFPTKMEWWTCTRPGCNRIVKTDPQKEAK